MSAELELTSWRRLVGELLGICEIDDAAILPLGVNELDLDGANVAIDARPAFLRGRGCLHGSTNSHSPVAGV